MNLSPFDEQGFLSGFAGVLGRIRSDPQAVAEYKHLVDVAYEQLDAMGPRISLGRLQLRASISRVHLAYKHLHTATPEKHLTIGDSHEDGTIVAVEQTAIGPFYRLQIDDTLVLDLYGGWPTHH